MDNLSAEIGKILDEELEKSRDAIEKAAEKVAQQTVDRLKQTSPKKTGKYARAWRKKATPLIRGKASYIVHNTRGQLTHLLEKGHALRSGGRTRAFPHIKPAEEEAMKNFERELIDLIERG
jgi:hypothetical protein